MKINSIFVLNNSNYIEREMMMKSAFFNQKENNIFLKFLSIKQIVFII